MPQPEDKSLLHSPSYIYSIGDRLCAITTKDSLSRVPNPDNFCFFESGDDHEFRALTYDYARGEVYFSEAKHRVRSIRRSHMVAKDNNTAVVQGVGVVNGWWQNVALNVKDDFLPDDLLYCWGRKAIVFHIFKFGEKKSYIL